MDETKHTSNQRQQIQQVEAVETTVNLLTEKEQQKAFYNVPNSPATDAMLIVMGAASSLATLSDRGNKVNHTREIEVLKNGNRRQVVISSELSTVTLELADIDKLIGSNKTAKKFLVFSLVKANEQALSKGELIRNYIQFPLQELVEIGFYRQIPSARRAFYDAMDILTSLKVKGTLRKGQKKTVEQAAIEVLFTGANIKNGTCTIFLNERINWAFISAFYMILPKFYFRLSNRASDLLYYIFYLARQNIDKIRENGYFTIGFRAIQERLNLPSEVGNKDPQRTIKEPIEDAIEAIENESNGIGFRTTPIYNMSDPIANYLSNGYLKIEMERHYAKAFIDLSNQKTKQIETAQKKREDVIKKALAINLAKKLESEEAGQKAKEKTETNTEQ